MYIHADICTRTGTTPDTAAGASARSAALRGATRTTGAVQYMYYDTTSLEALQPRHQMVLGIWRGFKCLAWEVDI